MQTSVPISPERPVTGQVLNVTGDDRARFFAALDCEPQPITTLAAMLGIENSWEEAACTRVTNLLEHLVSQGVLVRTGRPDHPVYATPRAAKRSAEEAKLRALYAQFPRRPPSATPRRTTWN